MTSLTTSEPDVAELVDRLVTATNAHDLDAVAACFSADYVNETPAHPHRSFRGVEQVRRNWSQIFAGVPDIRAEVLKSVIDGDTAWTEWELSGTRRDGVPNLMRGVMIFTASGGTFTGVRFYLEPVEHSSGDADAAIKRTLGTPAGATPSGRAEEGRS